MLVGNSALCDRLPQSLDNGWDDIRLTLDKGHWWSLQGAPDTAVGLGLTLVQFNGGFKGKD